MSVDPITFAWIAVIFLAVAYLFIRAATEADNKKETSQDAAKTAAKTNNTEDPNYLSLVDEAYSELDSIDRENGLFKKPETQGKPVVLPEKRQRQKLIDSRESNFAYAEMPGRDFSNRNLTGSNFTYAELQGADFRNANLTNCNFAYAELQGADFRGANLNNVSFTYAMMEGVKW